MPTLLLFMIILASAADARELLVPAEYATIQAALDDLEDGDTVTIALRTYEEELIAPSLNFLMRGDVTPDTGDYPRPIVDPSSLDSARTRACMRLQGASPVIENIRFHNGPEMFPHTSVGGVQVNSGNPVFRYCVFDSTYLGMGDFVSGTARVNLESCNFVDNKHACVRLLGGRITASNCLFSGQGFDLVSASDSCRFMNCLFRDDTTGHLLTLFGTGYLVEQCIFGHYGPFVFAPITGTHFGGKFSGCLFTDMYPGQNVMGIARDCAEPFEVGNCRFTDIEGPGGTAGVAFGCSENQPGIPAEIHNNVFDGFVADNDTRGKCIRVGRSGVAIERNRFLNASPPEASTIYCDSVGNILRDNLFFDTGYALEVCQFFCTADARWNWWGDSTGPYHPVLNPGGQGDQVSDGVEFDPWYTDTLFTQGAARERRELPQGFSLAAFPNPFNANTRLKLFAGDATILSLELFDILGRRVREIWSGPVLGEQTISLTAGDLPSGIYFARASDLLNNRPVAMSKLMLLR